MHETITSLDNLPRRTNRERDARQAVLRHLQELPVAAKTPGIKAPTYDMVAMTLPDGSQLFRQPFPRAKETVWLFDSEGARKTFLDLYVGERL